MQTKIPEHVMRRIENAAELSVVTVNGEVKYRLFPPCEETAQPAFVLLWPFPKSWTDEQVDEMEAQLEVTHGCAVAVTSGEYTVGTSSCP